MNYYVQYRLMVTLYIGSYDVNYSVQHSIMVTLYIGSYI